MQHHFVNLHPTKSVEPAQRGQPSVIPTQEQTVSVALALNTEGEAASQSPPKVQTVPMTKERTKNKPRTKGLMITMQIKPRSLPPPHAQMLANAQVTIASQMLQRKLESASKP